MTLTIRRYGPNDDVVTLTGLLHRAYAGLAERGLRYLATHQGPDVTAERFARGWGFIAEIDGAVVGTICLYGPKPDSTVPVFRDSATYHFGQYGVEPWHKGRGVGKALHEQILRHAAGLGGRFMALDTAAPATDLIAMYRRWGYEEIDRTAWSITNYQSVVMRRPITAGATATD